MFVCFVLTESDDIVEDPKAFVFSLKNFCHTNPFLKVSNGGMVRVKSSYGPGFVGKRRGEKRYEFDVDGDYSTACISDGFTTPEDYQNKTFLDLDRINLAGRRFFSIVDMEVFTVDTDN